MYTGIMLKSEILIQELRNRGYVVIKTLHAKEYVDESATHCPHCNKDCSNNLYFLNTGLCQTCDTL